MDSSGLNGLIVIEAFNLRLLTGEQPPRFKRCQAGEKKPDKSEQRNLMPEYRNADKQPNAGQVSQDRLPDGH